MIVRAFMIEPDQPDYLSQEEKKIVRIYVQSQWRIVLLWHNRLWQSSVQRRRHKKLCIISSL